MTGSNAAKGTVEIASHNEPVVAAMLEYKAESSTPPLFQDVVFRRSVWSMQTDKQDMHAGAAVSNEHSTAIRKDGGQSLCLKAVLPVGVSRFGERGPIEEPPFCAKLATFGSCGISQEAANPCRASLTSRLLQSCRCNMMSLELIGQKGCSCRPAGQTLTKLGFLVLGSSQGQGIKAEHPELEELLFLSRTVWDRFAQHSNGDKRGYDLGGAKACMIWGPACRIATGRGQDCLSVRIGKDWGKDGSSPRQPWRTMS